MAARTTHRTLEIVFLHEDHTWFTEIHEVRITGDAAKSVQNYWEDDLSKVSGYRKIVAASLFNENPEPKD